MSCPTPWSWFFYLAVIIKNILYIPCLVWGASCNLPVHPFSYQRSSFFDLSSTFLSSDKQSGTSLNLNHPSDV
jgi:hypothetical protein